MFACSRLKLIMTFFFCSYLKPKRDYIWILQNCSFIVADP